MAKKVVQSNQPSFRVNGEIKGITGNVRITGEGVESEVVSFKKALAIADEMNLDLIEINRNLDIPIMRIADYDKMIFDLKKKAKKAQHQVKPVKEVQLRVNIATNDLKTKANNTRKFISDGHKVKVVLTMKGRELSRREENKKSLFVFIDMLSDVAVPESMPKDEGTRTIVFLKKKG